jgi:hypothetical protein
MSAVLTPTAPPNRDAVLGEPTWEISRLFPSQGAWTEADFLAFDAPCLVDLNDGVLWSSAHFARRDTPVRP